MTPSDIMNACQQTGVTLGINAEGGLTYRGNREAVNRLLPAIRLHKPALMAMLAGKRADLNTLARSIGEEHSITPEQALSLLDDDDRALIGSGDQPTIEAWRCAVASRFRRGISTALTGNDTLEVIAPAKVTCASCRHAQPTSHPILVRCGAGRMAPGAGGLWWSSDRHECADFAGVTP